MNIGENNQRTKRFLLTAIIAQKASYNSRHRIFGHPFLISSVSFFWFALSFQTDPNWLNCNIFVFRSAHSKEKSKTIVPKWNWMKFSVYFFDITIFSVWQLTSTEWKNCINWSAQPIPENSDFKWIKFRKNINMKLMVTLFCAIIMANGIMAQGFPPQFLSVSTKAFFSLFSQFQSFLAWIFLCWIKILSLIRKSKFNRNCN